MKLTQETCPCHHVKQFQHKLTVNIAASPAGWHWRLPSWFVLVTWWHRKRQMWWCHMKKMKNHRNMKQHQLRWDFCEHSFLTHFFENSWKLSKTHSESSLGQKRKQNTLRLRYDKSYRRGQIEGIVGTELCPYLFPIRAVELNGHWKSKHFLRCLVGMAWCGRHGDMVTWCMISNAPFSYDSLPFCSILVFRAFFRDVMSGKQRLQELFAQYDDDGGGTEMVGRPVV